MSQNNAIDIYEQYFAGLAPDHGGAAPSARTLTVLRDPCAVRRPVSSVSWHPDASKVVLSHALLAFQQQPAGMPLESHVWDVSRPTEPEAVLCGPSPLVVSRFNVKDANLVGSGQYNGQFVLFDTRRGSAPAEATPMDVCHRCTYLALSAPPLSYTAPPDPPCLSRGRHRCSGRTHVVLVPIVFVEMERTNISQRTQCMHLCCLLPGYVCAGTQCMTWPGCSPKQAVRR